MAHVGWTRVSNFASMSTIAFIFTVIKSWTTQAELPHPNGLLAFFRLIRSNAKDKI